MIVEWAKKERGMAGV